MVTQTKYCIPLPEVFNNKLSKRIILKTGGWEFIGKNRRFLKRTQITPEICRTLQYSPMGSFLRNATSRT